MYKNVGKELKTWADILLWIIVLLSMIIAIVILFICVQSDMVILGLIAGAAYFLVSYLIARLSCIALYAFGELVHRTTEIDRHFVGAVDQK